MPYKTNNPSPITIVTNSLPPPHPQSSTTSPATVQHGISVLPPLPPHTSYVIQQNQQQYHYNTAAASGMARANGGEYLSCILETSTFYIYPTNGSLSFFFRLMSRIIDVPLLFSHDKLLATLPISAFYLSISNF